MITYIIDWIYALVNTSLAKKQKKPKGEKLQNWLFSSRLYDIWFNTKELKTEYPIILELSWNPQQNLRYYNRLGNPIILELSWNPQQMHSRIRSWSDPIILELSWNPQLVEVSV